MTVFPTDSLDTDVYATRPIGLFIVRIVPGSGWILESWQILFLLKVVLVRYQTRAMKIRILQDFFFLRLQGNCPSMEGFSLVLRFILCYNLVLFFLDRTE